MGMYHEKGRKFVEIEKGLSGRLELLCFLKEISQKDFVSRAVEKEIKPYETWLERIRQLDFGYAQDKPRYQHYSAG